MAGGKYVVSTVISMMTCMLRDVDDHRYIFVTTFEARHLTDSCGHIVYGIFIFIVVVEHIAGRDM